MVDTIEAVASSKLIYRLADTLPAHEPRTPGRLPHYTQWICERQVLGCMIAYSALRQLTVMLGFALGRNAIAAYLHRRRQPHERAA